METGTTSAQDWVLLNFLDFEKSLNGGAKLPLHAKRKEAFARFNQSGFPSPQMEEWKYTNVAPIREGKFTLTTAPSDDTIRSVPTELFTIPSLECHQIVLIDGFIASSLSSMQALPAGVSVLTFSDAEKGKSAGVFQEHFAQYAPADEHFVALNTAFVREGIVVHVAKGVVLDKPLHIAVVSTENGAQKSTNHRILVVAEANSEATVIESYASVAETTYFTNSVVECVVKENANLTHYRVQTESGAAYHVSTIQAVLENSATFGTHTFSFGGKLVRNNVNAVINGTGCTATMNGLSALTGDQHVDNHTLLDHAKPHGQSHELYKGIYDDASQGVFSGSIIVRPDAQKTNAIQSNRSLLLTDTAAINTKPQLKIWADDVKCTHGATIGQLDDDALFYIRSRGVGEKDAKVMLIHAFASEVISGVANEALREHLEGLLLKKLHIEVN